MLPYYTGCRSLVLKYWGAMCCPNALGCHVLPKNTGDAMCCPEVLAHHRVAPKNRVARCCPKILGCHVLPVTTEVPCIIPTGWCAICCLKHTAAPCVATAGVHVLPQSNGVLKICLAQDMYCAHAHSTPGP
jgi:hypothetical protein